MMIKSTSAMEAVKTGPACPDLRQLYGKRYRIEHDPAYFAEHGQDARTHDPWLLLISCRYGSIGPWDRDTLAASVDGKAKVASVIRQLEFCRVAQNGDDGELTATFAVADFSKVAKIIRPKRRRQLSAEQHERLVEMGRANLKRINHPHVEVEISGAESPQVPVDVSNVA